MKTYHAIAWGIQDCMQRRTNFQPRLGGLPHLPGVHNLHLNLRALRLLYVLCCVFINWQLPRCWNLQISMQRMIQQSCRPTPIFVLILTYQIQNFPFSCYSVYLCKPSLSLSTCITAINSDGWFCKRTSSPREFSADSLSSKNIWTNPQVTLKLGKIYRGNLQWILQSWGTIHRCEITPTANSFELKNPTSCVRFCAVVEREAFGGRFS